MAALTPGSHTEREGCCCSLPPNIQGHYSLETTHRGGQWAGW